MKLSKRELIMLVLLLIIAIVFIEFRFVVSPMINQYEDLRNEREAVLDEVQAIELNMAIAKQNETKRDENLEQIEQLSERFFSELKKDALLVRTHDIILEQGLNPLQYQFQQIQAVPLVPETYTAAELSYELKNLAETYRLLTDLKEDEIVTEETNSEDVEADSPVEQYQISFNVRGTYDQLNDYLDAVSDLQRSLIVASLSIVPDQNPPVEELTSEETLTDEENDQFLSIQITLYYYGLTKLIPTEDTFNQWYREPFEPVSYSPFKLLPVPEVTSPIIETTETIETEETTSETDDENTDG